MAPHSGAINTLRSFSALYAGFLETLPIDFMQHVERPKLLEKQSTHANVWFISYARTEVHLVVPTEKSTKSSVWLMASVLHSLLKQCHVFASIQAASKCNGQYVEHINIKYIAKLNWNAGEMLINHKSAFYFISKRTDSYITLRVQEDLRLYKKYCLFAHLFVGYIGFFNFINSPYK